MDGGSDESDPNILEECGNNWALNMLLVCPVRMTASQTNGYSWVVSVGSSLQMRTLDRPSGMAKKHNIQANSRRVVTCTEQYVPVLGPAEGIDASAVYRGATQSSYCTERQSDTYPVCPLRSSPSTFTLSRGCFKDVE